MNYQLESRMREIRQSGSEGGGPKSIASPYPYISAQGLLQPWDSTPSFFTTLKELFPHRPNAFSVCD